MRKPALSDIENAPEFFEPSDQPPPPQPVQENAPEPIGPREEDYDIDSKFNREFDQEKLRPLSYRNYPASNGKQKNDRSRKR